MRLGAGGSRLHEIHTRMKAQAHDWEKRHTEFVEFLARFDLRDGHRRGQPFTSPLDDVGRGWYGLLKELIEDLIAAGWDRQVLQIKEKFGTLRFYVKDRRSEFQARIDVAVEQSARMCELCGKPGSLRVTTAGWYCTRCNACWMPP
jgi:ribosomal protein L37AE/L43A